MSEQVSRWEAAKLDPEGGELWFCELWSRRGSDLSWALWLTPDDWGVGISVQRQRPALYWEGRLSLVVEFGPFGWHLTLTTPRSTSTGEDGAVEK